MNLGEVINYNFFLFPTFELVCLCFVHGQDDSQSSDLPVRLPDDEPETPVIVDDIFTPIVTNGIPFSDVETVLDTLNDLHKLDMLAVDENFIKWL